MVFAERYSRWLIDFKRRCASGGEENVILYMEMVVEDLSCQPRYLPTKETVACG